MTEYMEKAGTAETIDLSRRNLLVGSAGQTLGALAAPCLVHADDKMVMTTGGGGVRTNTLSDRLYSINIHNGVADIAHDPTDIPPPITRRTPGHVVVELETVEVAARLDAPTTYP